MKGGPAESAHRAPTAPPMPVSVCANREPIPLNEAATCKPSNGLEPLTPSLPWPERRLPPNAGKVSQSAWSSGLSGIDDKASACSRGRRISRAGQKQDTQRRSFDLTAVEP